MTDDADAVPLPDELLQEAVGPASATAQGWRRPGL